MIDVVHRQAESPHSNSPGTNSVILSIKLLKKRALLKDFGSFVQKIK